MDNPLTSRLFLRRRPCYPGCIVTTPEIRQPNEEPVFKRRKPDDPQSAEPGITLPAGLSLPDKGDTRTAPAPQVSRSTTAWACLLPPRPAARGTDHVPATIHHHAHPATRSGPWCAPGLPPLRPTARDPSERRTLVVGRGISVQGTVQDAERLVVEGTVEATMIHATELAISPGGIFKGEIEVEDAEIAGTIDGTLTARGA